MATVVNTVVKVPTARPRTPEIASHLRAPEGIRTPNLLIRSQMLYPLSYGLLFSVMYAADESAQRRREDLNLRSALRRTTH